MAESLTTSADATKDKRPNSGSSEGKSQGKNLILENFLIVKQTQKSKVEILWSRIQKFCTQISLLMQQKIKGQILDLVKENHEVRS